MKRIFTRVNGILTQVRESGKGKIYKEMGYFEVWFKLNFGLFFVLDTYKICLKVFSYIFYYMVIKSD